MSCNLKFIFIIFALALSSCGLFRHESADHFSGIGISVLYDSAAGYPYVVEILSGKPGAMAGLRSGDYILAVDGKSTYHKSADKTLKMLRGENGSNLQLKIKRGSNELQFESTREPIEVIENPANLCFSLDSLMMLLIKNDGSLRGDAISESTDFVHARLLLPKFEKAYIRAKQAEYKGLYYRCLDSVQCRRKFAELEQAVESCLTYGCCNSFDKECRSSDAYEQCAYEITDIKDRYPQSYRNLTIELLYVKGQEQQAWLTIRRVEN